MPLSPTATRDLLGTDDWHVIFSLAGNDTGIAADAGRSVDHHAPGISVRCHRRIQCRQHAIRRIRLGPSCDILQRPDGIEIARISRQPDEILGGQNLTPLRGGCESNPFDGPQRIGCAKAIGVDADRVADGAGVPAAVLLLV